LREALSQKDRLGLIAEIKKASPSKGLIREDFDHVAIARAYLNAGAEAISILTDRNFFQGSPDYLREVAAFSSAPLLRKDFIVDEYQILEARSLGADAVLLIAEALSRGQIDELTACAREEGLDVLLELHHESEIEKIDPNRDRLIGVNNRDLKTFAVDLGATARVKRLLPESATVVAESGIHTEEDVEVVKQAGASAVLVGERLMREKDVEQAARTMREWLSYAS
jgi:indole-3-glycerol phosphate synthase